MSDGSGWVRVVLDGWKAKDEKDRALLDRNVTKAMDKVELIHSTMVLALRKSIAVLSKVDRYTDLDELLFSIQGIREEGRASRIRVFGEVRGAERMEGAFVGQEMSDISAFNRQVAQYFRKEKGVYNHDLEHLADMLERYINRYKRNDDYAEFIGNIDLLRNNVLPNSIENYSSLYRKICEHYGEIKFRHEL